MRLIILLLMTSLVIESIAQKQCQPTDSLLQLSEKDLFYLSHIAEYEPDPASLRTTLPPVVDNSTLPYFRIIWAQQDYCCGQAASILYMFTYEINRLRNLPSNITDNQYPTHFAWNWQNGPDCNRGVSYMNSLELLKYTGTPNVTDWGGTPDFGGGTRWMTGYDKYYNAMHNKVDEYYSINVSTVEGLNVFRNWMHNHCENSSVGGMACIYIYFTSPNQTLPAGTPEAGKYIITGWGSPANHGMVIVGYNDSIRWDYNNDGQYTNHLDLNGDGVVNLLDWEIGGYKVANDFGTGWGNGGYAYVTYRTMALAYGQGGIWNNRIHIVTPKPTYAPLVTIRTNIEHTSRYEISVEAGISDNLTDTVPQYKLQRTIVNYQGGDRYMQGGTPSAQTLPLDFGLDITPLLNHVQSGQPARFFFRVKEYDTGSPNDGQITSFYLKDYAQSLSLTPATTLPKPITHNGITTLTVDHTPVFDRPVITPDSLPQMPLYSPFSYQMNATGGQPPYKWRIRMNYGETTTQEAFPNINTTFLPLGHWTNGKAEVTLNFAFPFFGETFTKIYVHTDGFISFRNENLPWVYLYEEDKSTLLKYMKGIGVFVADIEMLNTSHGTWIQQYTDSVIIRWAGSIPDYNGGHYDVNFAVKLRSDGTVSYYYGNCQTNGFQWAAGLSNGDYYNVYPLTISNEIFTLTGTQSYKMTPINTNILSDIHLSESGLFSGIVTNAYLNYPIIAEVTDNQGITNTKTITVSSHGVQFDYTVLSGGDTLIEYGESGTLSLTLRNNGTSDLSQIEIIFRSNNPLITVTDSILQVAFLGTGQQISFPACFAFNVSNAAQNETEVPIVFDISTSTIQQVRNESLICYRPVLTELGSYITAPASPVLLSGDTATLHVIIRNTSPARLIDATFQLQNITPYITQLSAPFVIDTLNGMTTDTLSFQVAVSVATPWETNVPAVITANARYQFSETIPCQLYINFNTETFETGDFLSYNWSHNGPQQWYITQPGYTGNYCVRSGTITHSQTSALIVQMETTLDGDISFYRKVDSETNYDFLRFYVDSNLKAEWSGYKNWEKVSFHIPAGLHLFKWIYYKDNTVSTGADCGWIDDIVFPPTDFSNLPFLSYTPASFSHTLPPNAIVEDTLSIGNIGGGNIQYRIRTINAQPAVSKSIAGSSLTTSLASFHAGDTIDIPLTVFNASTDSEWIRDLGIVIPQGIEVISATPFTGGTGGDMNYTGQSVTGDTAQWHGQDGSGWGVIRGGESATATVSLYIPPDYSDNLQLSYTIFGDIYGATPHELEGIITILNLGQILPWLTYSPGEDTLSSSEWHDVLLSFNSTGLTQGIYTCDIEIKGSNSQIFTIPAELRVSYLQFSPDSVYCEISTDSIMNVDMNVHNYFGLPFFVSSSVVYHPAATDTSWLSISPQALMIMGNSDGLFDLQFDATGLMAGTYEATARFMDQQYMFHNIPVTMNVFPLSLSESASARSIWMLYPNPAHDKLILRMGSDEKNMHFRIVSVTGQVILSGEIASHINSFDVKALPPGLYLMEITGNTCHLSMPFLKDQVKN